MEEFIEVDGRPYKITSMVPLTDEEMGQTVAKIQTQKGRMFGMDNSYIINECQRNEYSYLDQSDQIETLQTWGSSYVHVDGAGLVGTGPSLTVYNNTLYVSVIGSDSTVWETSMNTTTGAWTTPWTAIPNGSSKNTPSIVAFNGTLHSLVIGNDSNLYRNSINATTGTWSNTWIQVPQTVMPLAGTGISTTVLGSYLYVAYTGTDSNTYVNRMNGSGTWDSTWTKITGVTSGTPGLCAFNGNLYLMVVGTNNSIWLANMNGSSGVWGAYSQVNGSALVGGGVSLTTDGASLYASVIGTNTTGNNIYVANVNIANPSLTTWQTLPGTATGVPAIAAFNGKLYSMVIATDTGIWVDSAVAGACASSIIQGTVHTINASLPTPGQSPFRFDIYADSISSANLIATSGSIPGTTYSPSHTFNESVGSHTYIVQVTDSCTSPGAQVVTDRCTVNIVGPISVSLAVNPTSVNVGSQVTFTATVAGGLGPFTYAYSNLPPGCTQLNASSIQCNPSTAGTYSNIFVTVTDAMGSTKASSGISLTVNPVTATGSAAFTSTPSNASITIDGTLQTGVATPATITGLSVGSHTYKLSLLGFADVTGSFTVTAGATTQVTATFLGSAYIASTPSNASITIDGTLQTGVATPATITGLSAGSHTYKLSLLGFADVTGSFTATAGTIAQVTATFLASVYVTSSPSGASISIDGHPQTGVTTPATITGLTAGSHTYDISLSGYTDATGSFTATAGQTYNLSVTLTTGCVTPVAKITIPS